MHEIELGRLLEGDCFVHHTSIARAYRVTDRPTPEIVNASVIFSPENIVLIDDATMERVKQREAKNAGQ